MIGKPGQRTHPEADVHAAYERWSQTYDQQENPTRDLSSKVLRRLLPPLEGLTVVEAGCGTGLNSQWIGPACRRLIGLDLSAGMLALAKRKTRPDDASFVQCDLRREWPLASGSADLLLINLVLEHLASIEPVLAQAARKLRPGGQLIITEYHPDRVARGTGARIEKEGEEPIHIINFYHPAEEYREIGRQAGLTLRDTAAWFPEDGQIREPEREEPLPLILSLRLEKA